MNLRQSHVELAKSTRHHDPILDRKISGSDLYRHALRTIDELGLIIVQKPNTSLRFSKMSMTYYDQIRVGTGYPQKTDGLKAVLLMHELVHARQWRHYGRLGFGSRYVFDARFRWAMETQGYCETALALTATGWSEESITDYIRSIAANLKKTYALRLVGNAQSAFVDVLEDLNNEVSRS